MRQQPHKFQQYMNEQIQIKKKRRDEKWNKKDPTVAALLKTSTELDTTVTNCK